MFNYRVLYFNNNQCEHFTLNYREERQRVLVQGPTRDRESGESIALRGAVARLKSVTRLIFDEARNFRTISSANNRIIMIFLIGHA